MNNFAEKWNNVYTEYLELRKGPIENIRLESEYQGDNYPLYKTSEGEVFFSGESLENIDALETIHATEKSHEEAHKELCAFIEKYIWALKAPEHRWDYAYLEDLCFYKAEKYGHKNPFLKTQQEVSNIPTEKGYLKFRVGQEVFQIYLKDFKTGISQSYTSVYCRAGERYIYHLLPSEHYTSHEGRLTVLADGQIRLVDDHQTISGGGPRPFRHDWRIKKEACTA